MQDRQDARLSSVPRAGWTWLGTGALGVFTALATVLAHQFWTLDGVERVRELNTFREHLAIIAGFVLVAMTGVIGLRDSGRDTA